MSKSIFVDQFTYGRLLLSLNRSKDGLKDDTLFDHSLIDGSESWNLPVLSEYRSVFSEVRGLLRDFAALVEKDSEDIMKKTSAFVALDSKLGSSK